MRRFRHIAVWLLLATFVAGGVGGPVVHHLQHAAERMAAASDTNCHSAAFHNAELPVVGDAASEVTAPECDLCARRLLIVPPHVTLAAASLVTGTTQVLLRTHIAPVHVSPPRPIRGPPLTSGAHLV